MGLFYGIVSIAILIVILFAKNKGEFWNLLFIIPLIFYLIIFQILLNLQVESILFYLIPLLVLILISYYIKKIVNPRIKNMRLISSKKDFESHIMQIEKLFIFAAKEIKNDKCGKIDDFEIEIVIGKLGKPFSKNDKITQDSYSYVNIMITNKLNGKVIVDNFCIWNIETIFFKKYLLITNYTKQEDIISLIRSKIRNYIK
ncbi:hypothetical protein P9D39_01015 [Heyndrickxia oleronia]|uniref:hypothetical protein n=1 Tax=Heyndrickxia TaxID=2837504 RepID=UPI00090454CE|nr:hypothetical protein [Heyndrickxia oleronia]MEC1372910.1 hypothetical protein [Heyndrickxia oleronia]OJH17217.1 hypothetical protein BLX88_19540 [Bacillus obstructivus]QQZ03877.1 hypothetical protein I5818_19405 [Heyndrickxia oleronia]